MAFRVKKPLRPPMARGIRRLKIKIFRLLCVCMRTSMDFDKLFVIVFYEKQIKYVIQFLTVSLLDK